MKEHQIIQNCVKIIEDSNGEDIFLVSKHQHDYRTFTFKDKTTVSVDGGGIYIRRGFSNKEGVKSDGKPQWYEWSLSTASPLKDLKTRMIWKTYGKNNEFSQGKWILLNKAENSHLKAILKTEKQIKNSIVEKVIKAILKDRKNKKIKKAVKV